MGSAAAVRQALSAPGVHPALAQLPGQHQQVVVLDPDDVVRLDQRQRYFQAVFDGYFGDDPAAAEAAGPKKKANDKDKDKDKDTPAGDLFMRHGHARILLPMGIEGTVLGELTALQQLQAEHQQFLRAQAQQLAGTPLAGLAPHALAQSRRSAARSTRPRSKGSNTRSNSSGGMPGPSSSMRTTMPPSAVVSATVTALRPGKRVTAIQAPSGSPSSAATSSHFSRDGVGVFASGSAGAPRCAMSGSAWMACRSASL